MNETEVLNETVGLNEEVATAMVDSEVAETAVATTSNTGTFVKGVAVGVVAVLAVKGLKKGFMWCKNKLASKKKAKEENIAEAEAETNNPAAE